MFLEKNPRVSEKCDQPIGQIVDQFYSFCKEKAIVQVPLPFTIIFQKAEPL